MHVGKLSRSNSSLNSLKELNSYVNVDEIKSFNY